VKTPDGAASVPAAPWPAVAERASLLLAYLLTLPVEGYEKSFKMSERSLLDQRYLVGINVDQLTREHVFDICRKLDMPQVFLACLDRELAVADTLHFGFEQGEGRAIFKLYCEYWRQLDAARARGDESVVLHRAFKWDALDSGRHAVATYRCFPLLSPEQAMQRIARLYPGQATHPVAALAYWLLQQTADHHAGPALYLEVAETDNPRASFDLNLHAADLKLATIGPQLLAQAARYALPAGQFESLWLDLPAKTLGHLAGGTSRHGRDFLTIYYDPLS
jgi:hypothetical protein